jgi:hypothetical protein
MIVRVNVNKNEKAAFISIQLTKAAFLSSGAACSIPPELH